MNEQKQDVPKDSSPSKPSVQEQAKALLSEMSGEKKEPETPDPEKKPEDQEGKSEASKAEDETDPEALGKTDIFEKAKEELKIPRSRLNEEIEKRKAVEAEKAKLEKKLEEYGKKFSELTPEEKKEQESLRKLGIRTRTDDVEEALEAKKEELEKIEETIKAQQDALKEKELEPLKKRVTELEKKFDGSNGLPKFDAKELFEYAEGKNFFPDDPYELYKMKYAAELYAKSTRKAPAPVEKGNGKETRDLLPKKMDWNSAAEQAKALLSAMK